MATSGRARSGGRSARAGRRRAPARSSAEGRPALAELSFSTLCAPVRAHLLVVPAPAGAKRATPRARKRR